MKKHPIDDLFKRRLSDIERTPTSAAWQKIEAQAKKERRLGGWIWYAAASVVLAIIVGYSVWSNERANSNPIGLEKELANVQQKQMEPVKNEENKDSSGLSVNEKLVPVLPNVLANNDRKATEKGLNKTKSERDEQMNVSIEPDKNETEKLAETNFIIPQESIAELNSIKINPKTEEIASAKIGPEAPEPTRTIVVAVETDSNEAEDKPRLSKFSKVFRQLKNARAGERVDWDEVGFNPKSLVAKVDDRLRNGEEKVSEKYHNLKEKTKL
ncbi:hypothetical protein [Dyadobacter sp. CY326]|uniref:hypothetical protein n=1 Tax=Dyadobacter sp. CY326 TaxID=2907300 RepID=UPI001F1AF2A9|nr:hypothetical protein [Dyadobacter sp. CY326]MCE7068195.1 hypothetical protein [Dyadobacter sp. CY326]